MLPAYKPVSERSYGASVPARSRRLYDSRQRMSVCHTSAAAPVSVSGEMLGRRTSHDNFTGRLSAGMVKERTIFQVLLLAGKYRRFGSSTGQKPIRPLA